MKLPFIKRRLRRKANRALWHAQAPYNPGLALPNWIGLAVGAIDMREYDIEFLPILDHVCEHGWVIADEQEVIRFEWIVDFLRTNRGVTR